MKPYYRTKGRYRDGRKKIVIEYQDNGKTKSIALPKPEILRDSLKKEKFTHKKRTGQEP